MSRTKAGLAATIVISLVCLLASTASAYTLAPNTQTSSFKGDCYLTLQYGDYIFSGYAWMDGSTRVPDCGPSWVIVVMVDQNNQLHDSGQCPFNWSGPPCTTTSTKEQATKTVTGWHAFGIKIHQCSKIVFIDHTEWNCVDKAWTAFG